MGMETPSGKGREGKSVKLFSPLFEKGPSESTPVLAKCFESRLTLSVPNFRRHLSSAFLL